MGLFNLFRKTNKVNYLSDEMILGAVPLLQDLIDDTKKLLPRYLVKVEEYPWIIDGVLDIDKALRYMNPKADDRSCPHCGVMRDKPVKRGGKCRECGKKYIVRKGLIYKGDTEDRIYSLYRRYSDGTTSNETIKRCLEGLDGKKDFAMRAIFDTAELMIRKQDYDTVWRLLNDTYVVAGELDDYFVKTGDFQDWSDNTARVRELQAQACAHQASNMKDLSLGQRNMAKRSIVLSFLFVHEYANFYDREQKVVKTWDGKGNIVDSIMHKYHTNVWGAIEGLGDVISHLKITEQEIEECYQRAKKLTGGFPLRSEVREFINKLLAET